MAPVDLVCTVLAEHQLSPSNSWYGVILESLRSMSAASIVPLGDPEEDILNWREFICNDRSRWVNRVEVFSKMIDSYAVPSPNLFVPAVEQPLYDCPFCDMQFESKCAFNGHLWGAHRHRLITIFFC